jgi:Fe-S-cluster containining protein
MMANAASPFPRLPQIQPGGRLPCEEFGCSACCHDTEMLLTEADVTRLAVTRPDVDFVFRSEDGFLQLRTREGPAAKGGVGRPCVFLDNVGRCTVHEARPEGCRLYPAVWDADHERVELDRDYCPHPDGFVLSPHVRDAVQRLADRLLLERDRRTSSPK